MVRIISQNIHVNFNFITDGSNSSLTPASLLRSLEESLKTSGLQQDFELLSSINASQAPRKQIKILHKKSRIRCVLLFDNQSTVELATKVISDYMTQFPICKFFFARYFDFFCQDLSIFFEYIYQAKC